MKKWLFLLLLAAHPAAAEDFCRSAEAEIKRVYQAYKQFDDNSPDEAALGRTVAAALNNPQSIACDWAGLKDFNFAISPDKKLATLDWEEGGGGTMRLYYGAWQYRAGKKAAAGYEAERIGFVTDIAQMPLNGQTVYFISNWGAGYTSLHGLTLRLYRMENGQLMPAKLIRTAKGLTHEIGFAYNPFFLPNTGRHRGKLIHIDPKTKTFTVPVVIDDQKSPNGRVTNRSLKYRFDGRVFRYVR